jgi:CRP/FNR family transcriptional regulator, cyclic AMP receptor protein
MVATHAAAGTVEAERLLFLKRVTLFASLRNEALIGLSAILSEQSFSDGDLVVTQGEPGDTLYILKDGFVEVVVGGATAGTIVAQLKPCDFFGEMALFEDQPRSATVRAKGECHVLELRRSHFVELVDRQPDVLWNLCAAFARRLRATNQLVNS